MGARNGRCLDSNHLDVERQSNASNHTNCSHWNQDQSPSSNKSVATTLEQDSGDQAGSGMKRFSSAQCLVDENLLINKGKSMGGKSKQHKRKQNKAHKVASNNNNVIQQQSSKQRLSANYDNSSDQLLAPDDPMILARQRRPSVSNQGSVNVDQQGEFRSVHAVSPSATETNCPI